MAGQPVNLQLIKNTLLARLSAVTFPNPVNGHTTWNTAPTRRLKMWGNVDPGAQPCAFLVQHNERYETSGVGLVKRYLDLGFWCYAPSGDADVVGDDLLDFMTSGIEAVMQPDDLARNEFTLGGLVYWCRIVRGSGIYIRDPGDIDGQAMLVLPIVILIP